MLSKKERRSLQRSHRKTYLYGACYDLALALHRGTGWPLIGFIGFSPSEFPLHLMMEDLHNPNDILHVAVRCPNGKILDIRGFLTRKVARRGFDAEIKKIRLVTEQEVRTEFGLRLKSNDNINKALEIAKKLWPRLAWKK